MVEGACLLVVLISRLSRRGTGLVGVLNEVPEAVGHEFGPPAVQCESRAPLFFCFFLGGVLGSLGGYVTHLAFRQGEKHCRAVASPPNSRLFLGPNWLSAHSRTPRERFKGVAFRIYHFAAASVTKIYRCTRTRTRANIHPNDTKTETVGRSVHTRTTHVPIRAIKTHLCHILLCSPWRRNFFVHKFVFSVHFAVK